ncbi:MAG: response regulator transcription factor [Prevotella sp.]|nr:response regulator transcription factor [Prevotella sp.]MBR5061998.1 response regulator transcription factor [Prevotella sp.]
MKIYLADNQDITRAGLMYIIQGEGLEYQYTSDKVELIECLKDDIQATVILDYTLFDINDAAELLILYQRFPRVKWLLFSEDLSLDFVRFLMASCNMFSVLLKESPMSEIREAIRFVLRGQRYVCQRMMEMLLFQDQKVEEQVNLTKTEVEILKDIALGMTTKEIAEKRFSSFHTVNTHRKNIFRKLNVNTVHEATKYALRAGLVDSAEYYI